MVNQDKLVSIGLPVYNGERFLRQTLDSLLAQEYKNFELIISDNASTDKTEEICQEYTRKDRRIQYYRNERNLGAARNFNRVFELSSGEYFMWASANDLWDKTYISQCVQVLNREPEVVLCYSQTTLIDFQGKKLEILPDRFDTRSFSNPVQRFSRTLQDVGWCNILHGLIRAKMLKQTRLFIPTITAGDHLLLAELSLWGTFAQISTPLFYRRKSDPIVRAINKQPIAIDSGKKISFPHFRLLVHSLISARNVPLDFKEKLKLMVNTFTCIITRFRILEDLHLLGFFRRLRKLKKKIINSWIQ